MTIQTHAEMVQSLKSDDYASIMRRMTASSEIIDIDHAILGIHTEGAELADAFKRYKFYGTELDMVNIKEEVGDLLFYVQLLASSCDFTLEEAMDLNEAKLKKRYGDKFTQEAAVTRDLDAEREVLEDKPTEAVAVDRKEYHDNLGIMPVPQGTLIDIVYRNGERMFNQSAGNCFAKDWIVDSAQRAIIKWRLAYT